MPGVAAKASKRFFFEKKNQKTFIRFRPLSPSVIANEVKQSIHPPPLRPDD
jgi:hypothetical protein